VAFIANFIRRFGFFPLAGSGDGRRQPLHAEDLAQACVTVLGIAATYNRAYNLSGGETLTYRQMVERIFTALGRKPRVFELPLPLFHAAFAMLRLLSRYRYLNTAMIARMSDDLVFDHSEASRDFGFGPGGFLASSHVRL
jgi:nucleoside-diphosphate-sugar epimerase